MCIHLHKAPNGVYYFRLSIPAELRPRFDGRREIKHSLRTKDRDAVKKLIPDHIKAAMALLDDARALTAPAPLPKPQAQIDLERARWDWEREQEALVEADADNASNELEELGPVMDALEAGVFSTSPTRGGSGVYWPTVDGAGPGIRRSGSTTAARWPWPRRARG